MWMQNRRKCWASGFCFSCSVFCLAACVFIFSVFQPWKVRKVGGNAERAIKECVVLCSVTVACSTGSVIATAALHILLPESSNRGMLRCPFYKTVMAWQSVQLNKVAWDLHSSCLYLQRWQLLCPSRSIQEVLRDTPVTICLLLCLMEKLCSWQFDLCPEIHTFPQRASEH